MYIDSIYELVAPQHSLHLSIAPTAHHSSSLMAQAIHHLASSDLSFRNDWSAEALLKGPVISAANQSEADQGVGLTFAHQETEDRLRHTNVLWHSC